MKKNYTPYGDVVDWFMKFTSTGYQHELVYQKQVELLYKQIPQVLLAVLAISSILAYLFYAQEEAYTLSWLASIYVFTLIRFYYYFQWKNRPESRSSNDWAHLGTNFSFISGIQWATAVLIFFHPGSMVDIAILIIVLLGMISGAVASLSIIPAAFTLYTAPITVFLIARIFATHNPTYYPLAWMIVIFVIANSLFCRNNYKSSMAGIRLSIENQDLVENLKKEKEKAEAANLAKSKFLASASHDLRQPLQSMTLFTEALRENLEKEIDIELAERITSSHNALRELLNALLDISKLDAGGVQVHKTVFDINEITGELQEEFEPLAHKKNQQLAFTKSSCRVFSDPIIIKRIMQNLLANAIKYSPEEALVIVETHCRDNFLQINIRDNGPGIPAHEQEYIFDEFYQLQNPERDRKKGLGLGLAIVKRLTQLIDSEITLESIDGNGCNFSFKLPLATKEQEKSSLNIASSNSTLSLQDVRILLVEDEVDVRDAMRLLLQRWGCKVWETDNIQQALEIIGNNSIDLVITDYRLREHETGITLLKEIHQRIAIPGIMITGDTAAEQIQEFLQTGHTVLHKPVKPAELRMAIQQINQSGIRQPL